ncbi:MAG: RsmF rRNA methyltransferase first C-terminal domain-containing protein [Bacteroidales bacterium]|nr:RsmF rRNA methyltransferase first C-terminal domain-containing protein [Bacteroidales bacterium]MCM1414295.1 RsmF rRNA methyltransferase first C-terminal domain-containing protein [bacterium]MCM1422176.1 RsmF rRNA methyltransferase first C-terminal domain-containing protein [bacterium]
MKLPEAFLARMEHLLGGEYEAFLRSYGEERQYGLRRNPLKASEETFIRVMPFPLQKIAWAREGYSYDAASKPGSHVFHEAGAYYIQEPSAMAAVEALDPQPGERILDLCAAPGGKTTQIAGRMDGKGLLVANEVVGERAKILSQNVERMGIANCVVCSEKPERLSMLFPAFFDRVLVDAPCSGEGMFRKEPAARGEWSKEAVAMCADRQAAVMREAAKLVKPGGVLVYSTCTFSPEENEGTVSAFLREQEAYHIEDIPCGSLFSPGRQDWIMEAAPGIERTGRIWPHLQRGEGHFVARLRRNGAGEAAQAPVERKRREAGGGKSRGGVRSDSELCKLADGFLRDELEVTEAWRDSHTGRLFRFGEQIYLMPGEMPPLAGIRVLRPGLQLMTEKKKRFEPAHALALSLKPDDIGKKREVSYEEALGWLRGESLSCQDEEGWTALFYEGFCLGFGKASAGQMKNHYPKGLRKNL